MTWKKKTLWYSQTPPVVSGIECDVFSGTTAVRHHGFVIPLCAQKRMPVHGLYVISTGGVDSLSGRAYGGVEHTAIVPKDCRAIRLSLHKRHTTTKTFSRRTPLSTLDRSMHAAPSGGSSGRSTSCRRIQPTMEMSKSRSARCNYATLF